MTEQGIHTLLYYKFTEISEPDKFAQEHLKTCKEIGLLGRVLVGKEGINGSVCGTKDKTDRYKQKLRRDKRFSDMVFKEDIGKSEPFTKIKVLVKDEIIAMKTLVDLRNKGAYISPEEFLDLCYGRNEGEKAIILDARNDYEWKVGRFKDALVLPIKTFREFPMVAKKLLPRSDHSSTCIWGENY